jgi:broad specificity phosphatase PhoE
MWQEGTSKSSNSDLSKLGKQQVSFLASHLKNFLMEYEQDYKIFSSPLKRSIQTVKKLDIKYEIAYELEEAAFHTASKLPSIDDVSLYEKYEIKDNDYLKFKNNLNNKLNEIITISKSKNIFLFTHGVVIKTILRIIHDNDGIDYIINNCSATKIVWHRARWTVNYINNTSFLPKHFIT